MAVYLFGKQKESLHFLLRPPKTWIAISGLDRTWKLKMICILLNEYLNVKRNYFVSNTTITFSLMLIYCSEPHILVIMVCIPRIHHNFVLLLLHSLVVNENITLLLSILICAFLNLCLELTRGTTIYFLILLTKHTKNTHIHNHSYKQINIHTSNPYTYLYINIIYTHYPMYVIICMFSIYLYIFCDFKTRLNTIEGLLCQCTSSEVKIKFCPLITWHEFNCIVSLSTPIITFIT